jgi:hypothetical protein
MVRVRALAWLVALLASGAAQAQVTAYEWVYQTGRNNLIDSNASSCDAAEGCYTRLGQPCSENPGQLCDLQIVPAGRCTSGELSTGQASCVWPHNAGRCVSNQKVGCLTDAFVASPILANAVTGPSFMCAGLASNSCDMTIDKYGDAQTAAEIVACNCQGTDAAAASFEISICAGPRPVCSDGDRDRDTGGFGYARRRSSPARRARSSSAARTERERRDHTEHVASYAIENPPSAFDPQRAVGRTPGDPAGAHYRRALHLRALPDARVWSHARMATRTGATGRSRPSRSRARSTRTRSRCPARCRTAGASTIRSTAPRTATPRRGTASRSSGGAT